MKSIKYLFVLSVILQLAIVASSQPMQGIKWTKQGNGFYTWWSHYANSRERNVGWRIDYVLVSQALKSKVKAAKIHPDVMGSDHCPVSIELDL